MVKHRAGHDPAGRPEQAGHRRCERRLSRPGLTGDAEHFAAVQGQVDTDEGVKGGPPHAVIDGDVADLEDQPTL